MRKKTLSGYSLVEVLVAIAILMMGVGAAASISMTMTRQEESSATVNRAIAWHEKVSRLYQLGLSQSEIEAVLPPLRSRISLSFSSTAETISGVGSVDVLTTTLVINTHPAGEVNNDFKRTHVLKSIRSTF
ncbi:MAG: prepilin-type N-terminal cleavage/methylation domain-containing protein [Verrucomicrobiota bacterium]